MRKEDRNVTKGIGSAGEHQDVLKGENSSPSIARLPELPPMPAIMTSEELKSYLQKKSALVQGVRARGKRVGEVVGDPNIEHSLDDLRELESGVVATIVAVKDRKVRYELALAYVSALVEFSPASAVGLNHVADQGLAVEFLHRVSEGSGVRLPVTEDRRWKWTDLRCPPSEGKLQEAIRKIAAQVQEVFEEKKAEDRKALEEGASQDLLATLEKDGEVVFYVPFDNEKGYAGGNVRVRVEDGWIHPVGATGKCARIVERAAEYGVVIPVDSVYKDRIQLEKRVEDREVFKTILAFHGLCHRGWLKAKEKQGSKDAYEAMKAKGRVPAAGFVLRNAEGQTFLFMRNGWTVGKGKDAREYRRVSFLCERNAGGEVRVAECPDYLEELFANCREFKAAGEKFQGLEYPLGHMLRVLYATFSSYEHRGGDGKPEPKAEPTAEELKVLADLRKQEADAELEARRNAVAEAEEARIASRAVKTI